MRANVFTRILLAQFGELSWQRRADHAGRADPAAALVPDPSLPHVLLGAHRDGAACWCWRRCSVRARNPRGIRIQELFATTGKAPPKARRHQQRGWALFFDGLDRVLKVVEPFWPKSLRRRAIERCAGFVTERLNGEDGLGAIYPAMANCRDDV